MNLRTSAAAGVRWSAAAEAITVSLHLVQTVVLARLLAPEDFGLMAMTLMVVGLAHAYADLGISNALIYRQDTTREQLSSLYWLTVISGLATFFLVLATAPLAAALFGEPRLQDLVMLVAVVFLVAPAGQQFQLLLQKHLRFRELAWVEIAAAITGITVAVISALGGQGVYAIVWGHLAGTGVKAGLFFRLGWSEWRPALRFRRSDLRGYVRFGLYQMGERSINYLSSRLDQALIGGLLGAQALGYYHLAHMIVIQPTARLNPVVTRVAFPVFSRMQTEFDALKDGYLLMIRALASVNFPMLFCIAILAPYFLPLFFGEQWSPAIALVQILSLVALLRSTGNPVGALLLARGRADLGFKWNTVILLINIPVLLLGAHWGGVTGVAWALLLYQVSLFFPNYWFLVRSQIGPCFGDYLQAMVPAFLLSALMAAAMLVVTPLGGDPSVLSLGLLATVGGTIYAISYYLFQREQFRTFRDMVLRI